MIAAPETTTPHAAPTRDTWRSVWLRAGTHERLKDFCRDAGRKLQDTADQAVREFIQRQQYSAK